MTLVTTKTAKQPADGTGRMRIVMGLAAILVAAWVILGKNAEDNIGFILGFGFASSLIVWAIAYFVFLRPHVTPQRARRYYFVLFGVSVVTQFGFIAWQKAQVRAAATDIQQTIATSTNKTEPGGGQAPVARGEMGTLAQLVRNNYADGRALYREYDNALAAIGADKIFDPATLAADHDLTETRFKARRMNQIVQQYRDESIQRFDKWRNDLVNSDLSNDTKQAALKGFDEQRPVDAATADKLWTMEASISDEMTQMVDLLYKEQGKWTIQKNKIIFLNNQDFSQYNEDIKRLQNLIQNEQSARAQVLTDLQARIQKLKDSVQ